MFPRKRVGYRVHVDYGVADRLHFIKRTILDGVHESTAVGNPCGVFKNKKISDSFFDATGKMECHGSEEVGFSYHEIKRLFCFFHFYSFYKLIFNLRP